MVRGLRNSYPLRKVTAGDITGRHFKIWRRRTRQRYNRPTGQKGHQYAKNNKL